MIDLFFSYAHQDEEMRDELEVHLAMLKRSGLVSSWHDRRIGVGMELHQEISQQLEDADVILSLLSPYFLASDYCYEREAQRALQRHREGTAVVIPVILQPCDWLQSPFRELRATPQDGKPVAKFPNVHDAFLEVTQDIRAAAESLQKGTSVPPSASKNAQDPSHASTAKSASGPFQDARSSNLRLKKTFTDRDRDEFADEAFAYIGKFFENSLTELRERNPSIEFRCKQLSATGFTATAYAAGTKRTSCHIWLAQRRSFGVDIAYSANDVGSTNSMNEGFTIGDDGVQLGLRTTGMAMTRSARDGLLTTHGAAEHLWSMFISPLQ